MIISAKFGDRTFQIDTDHSIDISIPLEFNGAQPNAYGVAPATAEACEYGELVGDTRRGGSCNFEQYTLIPHCNGTHTECVGHITHERISVRDCLRDAFIPARLISVEPESVLDTDDNYLSRASDMDYLITHSAVAAALELSSPPSKGGVAAASADGVVVPPLHIGTLPPADPVGSDFALIVRTLPNEKSKKTRLYTADVPPFFSYEAMKYMVELGVKHLLVDLPSIDRLYDNGELSNHRIFWNIEPGSFETGIASRMNSTVTELIYVPDDIPDGDYLLNLQIAPFASDASPSRPIIFRIQD